MKRTLRIALAVATLLLALENWRLREELRQQERGWRLYQTVTETERWKPHEQTEDKQAGQ